MEKNIKKLRKQNKRKKVTDLIKALRKIKRKKDNTEIKIEREIKKGWARWTIKYGKCKNCKRKISYHDKYDAYYCRFCNIWLEQKCGDKKCESCSIRPIQPLK